MAWVLGPSSFPPIHNWGVGAGTMLAQASVTLHAVPQGTLHAPRATLLEARLVFDLAGCRAKGVRRHFVAVDYNHSRWPPREMSAPCFETGRRRSLPSWPQRLRANTGTSRRLSAGTASTRYRRSCGIGARHRMEGGNQGETAQCDVTKVSTR